MKYRKLYGAKDKTLIIISYRNMRILCKTRQTTDVVLTYESMLEAKGKLRSELVIFCVK